MEFDLNLLATFALLVGLELVLGIDNILLISILTDRLPPETRDRARIFGLSLALVARFALLLGASYLLRLSEPVIAGYSYKDIILMAGGLFLLYKAVKEIHHAVEKPDPSAGHASGAPSAAAVAAHSGAAIIGQIVLLDIVFSIDSVITAVGLTNVLWVIYTAVIFSFVLVLLFAAKTAAIINSYPALKILALSFLITIGVTLCIEGFGGHVPKSYIYLPMGFALVVELLQIRASKNANKNQPKP